ncbi:MAG: FHA domain-containing protein [Ktedonobacterales bacterium]
MATPQSRLIVHRLASADGGSEDGPSIEVGEFILDGRDIAIGRAPSCDIVLEGDQLASRRHALLRSRSEGYTVVDLGSSNGTYINDLEIREAVLLHEGDHISIGGHELIYSTSPASPHASLAGVKLAEPEASPMVDTDPNAVAVSARDTAVSPAVSEASATPTSAPANAVWSLPEDEMAPIVGVAGTNGGGASVSAVIPEVEADQGARRDEGSGEAILTASGSPSSAKPEPDFAASSTTDADFEALRAQLAAVSEALARKATIETRIIKQLRGALASARDQLAALAAQTSTESETTPAANVDDLITIARQAAENSRHLDYLTVLAEHAGEIADALASNPSGTSGIPASVLEALRAQLDEALS